MGDLNKNGSNGKQTENKGTRISPVRTMALRFLNTGLQDFPFGTVSWSAMYRGLTVKNIKLRTRNAKVQGSILCFLFSVNEHLKVTTNPICKSVQFVIYSYNLHDK
jgi:hypothetical protein